MGLVLGCYVSAANVADVKAAPAVLVWVLEQYERMEKILADQSYRGDEGRAIESGIPVCARGDQTIGRRLEGRTDALDRRTYF